MTDYQDYEDKQLTVTGATIRKTRVEGETRYAKYILDVDAENIESMSMKLEEYYSEQEKETISGVNFDTEELDAEPVKAEDIPDIVLKIQEHLNNKDSIEIQATITVAKDEEKANWFINPENFDSIQVIDDE